MATMSQAVKLSDEINIEIEKLRGTNLAYVSMRAVTLDPYAVQVTTFRRDISVTEYATCVERAAVRAGIDLIDDLRVVYGHYLVTYRWN